MPYGTRFVARPALAAAAIIAAAALAGCSTQSAHSLSASEVIKSLGAVPIPSAGPAEFAPSAAAGHPAILAIGGPVRVALRGGSTALVTALGPQQLGAPTSRPGGGPPQTTRAVITLRVATTKGSTTLAAADLSTRDQTGHALTLTPDGPPSRTVAAGTTASINVVATFASGAAQLTWRYAGKVLAIWTFNIELD